MLLLCPSQCLHLDASNVLALWPFGGTSIHGQAFTEWRKAQTAPQVSDGPAFNFPPNILDTVDNYGVIRQDEQLQEVYKTLPYPYDMERGYEWRLQCSEDVDRTVALLPCRVGTPILMGLCINEKGKANDYINRSLANGDTRAARVLLDPDLYAKGRMYISRGLFEDEHPGTRLKPLPVDLEPLGIRPEDFTMRHALELIVYAQWLGAQNRYGAWEGKRVLETLRVTAIRRSVGKDGIVRLFPELEVPNPRHPRWKYWGMQGQPWQLIM